MANAQDHQNLSVIVTLAGLVTVVVWTVVATITALAVQELASVTHVSIGQQVITVSSVCMDHTVVLSLLMVSMYKEFMSQFMLQRIYRSRSK